jgi:hypothetical protein
VAGLILKNCPWQCSGSESRLSTNPDPDIYPDVFFVEQQLEKYHVCTGVVSKMVKYFFFKNLKNTHLFLLRGAL